MSDVKKSVKEALFAGYPNFVEETKQFFNKEIKPGDYKKISGAQGCYGERGANSVMYRLRFPGGAINKVQIKFLIDAIKEHNIELSHISTGQCLQLHHLNEDTVIKLFPKAHRAGIYTRGAGGDNPRNMTGAPLRGVVKGVPFDIAPYFKAAQEYLLTLITTLKLPRKYKIAFSTGLENHGHGNFKELGFIAQQDGTFTVYAGGGLGPNPRIGTKVAEKVDPKDVLYYMHGMGKVYEDFGDFSNKAKARGRYIVSRLGEEEFIRVFNEYVEKSKSTESLDIIPEDISIHKAGTTVATSPRAEEQVQEGLYYVNYHPFGGDLDKDTFLKLLEYVYPLEDVEIRLNTNESLYVINLTGEEADQVETIVEADNANTVFDTSVSCVGSTVCQIGLRDSAGTLHAIRDAVKSAKIDDTYLPQIRISGCTNSCSAHHTGIVGLQGFSKKVNDVIQPAFTFMVGGSDALEDTHFGVQKAVITQEDLPKFFVELGTLLADAKEHFETWYISHSQEFDALIAKYN